MAFPYISQFDEEVQQAIAELGDRFRFVYGQPPLRQVSITSVREFLAETQLSHCCLEGAKSVIANFSQGNLQKSPHAPSVFKTLDIRRAS